MEIEKMSVDEINVRLSAIKSEMEADGADLDALTAEVDKLQARKKELAAAETARQEIRNKIAAGAVEVTKVAELDNTITEDRKMDLKELRGSAEYMEAYADYMKHRNEPGADKQLRDLLSTVNAVEGSTQSIPVPLIVDDYMNTAWNNETILADVPTINVNADVAVPFEISATDAVRHQEGAAAIEDEELSTGFVTLKSTDAWKKNLPFTKAAMKMGGESFIRYIYDEFAHKLAKVSADDLVAKIAALPTVATKTTPSAQQITEAPSIDVVSNAISYLTDEATDPVVILHRRSAAAIKAAAKQANYALDPFEGCRVKYNNSLPAYADAEKGKVWMIVGDLKQGAKRLAPDGTEPEYTFDNLTRKKENVVEVMGEVYGDVAPVCCDAFVNVLKPEEI